MQIQNNLSSMNAARNQGIATGKLKKSLEKLSSGYRIVRAGDDAAGLAISELMRSRINGLNQAMDNIDDGMGLTNVGDGALTEVHSILNRMKTLAVQASNGTYNTQARADLDMERKEETLDVARYYMGSKELLLDKTDFTSVDKANDSIQYLDNAIEAVSDVRASFGAAYNHLQRTHNNLSVTTENMTAAENQIRDTNMAQEFTDYTAANIQLQVSDSMLSQANALPDLVLKILNS